MASQTSSNLFDLRCTRSCSWSSSPWLDRCLGPLTVSAQVVASVGFTFTAVINIPEAVGCAGDDSWVCYAMTLVVIVLVAETLVLFRHQPGNTGGNAG
jgi:hypothetical protein